jgi:hypothetical protein
VKRTFTPTSRCLEEPEQEDNGALLSLTKSPSLDVRTHVPSTTVTFLVAIHIFSAPALRNPAITKSIMAILQPHTSPPRPCISVLLPYMSRVRRVSRTSKVLSTEYGVSEANLQTLVLFSLISNFFHHHASVWGLDLAIIKTSIFWI